MILRQATETDLPAIMAILMSGIQSLKKQGSPQWQGGYGPTEERMRKDIEQQWTYVLETDQQVVAVASLIPGIDPVYEAIDGNWHSPSADYVSIHRFAVNASEANQGLGKLFLRRLIEHLLESGKKDIRIDTHQMNIGMQKVAKSVGFQYCGTVTFPIPNGERFAYQYR